MSSTQDLVSPPFIIWTLRRTGGTNLAQALFERSPHQGVQHEPFNEDRLFSQVTLDWLEHRDEQALRDALREICDRQVLIKHCVEPLPSELNTALAEISTQAGYQHIFLYRRQPLGRLLSLHFANVSGVWGKPQAGSAEIDQGIFRSPIPIEDLLRHEQNCRSELGRIFDLLVEQGETPRIAVFEDIYFNTEPQSAVAILQQLFRALHLEQPEEDPQLFDRLLNNGSQGTRSKYRNFVNYAEFAERLETLGDFDLQHAKHEQIKVQLHPLPSGIEHAALWDTHFDPFSGTHTLRGAVLVSADAKTPGELWLRTGNQNIPITWSLKSPKIQERFPNNPHAQKARLQLAGVTLRAGDNAEIVWVDTNGEKAIIASLTAEPVTSTGDNPVVR